VNIHEYQAKELFRRYGIPTPEGRVVRDRQDVADALKKLSLPLAVKAQIHAGGRGKGGGVRVAFDEKEAREFIDTMFGMILVTPQTGPAGRKVHALLLEKGVEIARELYFSLVVDRSSASITIIVSQCGGTNIEEVAAAEPEKVVRVKINPLLGLQAYHSRLAAAGLGLGGGLSKQLASLLQGCYRLFTEYDCTLVEINPLVVTDEEKLIALDAKINFDDNALYRHPDLQDMRDPEEEDPAEREAAKFHLNYISLDGNVGNMVNGAGLAMATMDIIKKAGAEPANFLDVGGGADAEMVENGFRIILGDPKVRGIFINIFGGILRCDVLARGVVEAADKIGLKVPVVVRMEGTNVEEGRRILAESGLDLIPATDLADAAAKVAAMVREER
jgi:succinyl-CoA synthetase beta subunit